MTGKACVRTLRLRLELAAKDRLSISVVLKCYTNFLEIFTLLLASRISRFGSFGFQKLGKAFYNEKNSLEASNYALRKVQA